MMSSKKVLTKGYGQRAATACALMVLVVLLVVPSTGMGASKPTTMAELALYQGPDREQILIEGAKKEGRVTVYTSNTYIKEYLAKEFEKKYPFIKAELWRGDSSEHARRVMEETRAEHYVLDVIESDYEVQAILAREGIIQEFYSPELRSYPDSVILKGEKGVFYCALRENYIGLGFNTKLISPAEVPKNYLDLLDPKWKGQMCIPGSGTGVNFILNIMDSEGLGRSFIEQLIRQNVSVQNVSGAALAGMVVSGEVPLSPSIWDSNVRRSKAKGAPIEWRPLEPVFASVSYAGIAANAPHPHAAILLQDYLLSKEGQQFLGKGGLHSGRVDIESKAGKFKKNYLDSKYPIDVFRQKWDEAAELQRQFIKK